MEYFNDYNDAFIILVHCSSTFFFTFSSIFSTCSVSTSYFIFNMASFYYFFLLIFSLLLRFISFPLSPTLKYSSKIWTYRISTISVRWQKTFIYFNSIFSKYLQALFFLDKFWTIIMCFQLLFFFFLHHCLFFCLFVFGVFILVQFLRLINQYSCTIRFHSK